MYTLTSAITVGLILKESLGVVNNVMKLGRVPVEESLTKETVGVSPASGSYILGKR